MASLPLLPQSYPLSIHAKRTSRGCGVESREQLTNKTPFQLQPYIANRADQIVLF